MDKQDLLALKLCAFLDRPVLANRDIFDVWYLMSQKTPVNPRIVEEIMEQSLLDYLDWCITSIEKVPSDKLLGGLGEVLDEKLKSFVRTKLKERGAGICNDLSEVSDIVVIKTELPYDSIIL